MKKVVNDRTDNRNGFSNSFPEGSAVDDGVCTGDTIFRICEKCGARYKSHRYSKSRQCRHCANLEGVRTYRRKKGITMKCPYCGEEFVAIHGAKHCQKSSCKAMAMSAYHSLYGKSIKLKCQGCGIIFEGRPRQRFCSTSCAARNNAKNKALGESTHRQRVEECLKHISLCKTKGELKRRFPNDYNFCHRYRLDEYSQLANKPNVTIKYTDEEIVKAASKYQYKLDFRKKEPNLYAIASRRGLVSKLKLRTSPHLFDAINYVYRYHFVEQNAVYIGRTKQPKQRDLDHRRDCKNRSVVFRFAFEHCVEIPKMEILERGLSGEESQKIEDEYVNKYKEAGFVVLNKGATGVGVGSMGMRRQYSEKTFLKVARTYTSYSQLKVDHPKLFHAGERYGWLKQCLWLQHDVRLKNTLTKAYCLEVASKYSSRSELNDADPSVYNKIRENNWWRFCPQIKRRYRSRLSDAELLRIAKGYKCITALQQQDSTIAHELYNRGLIGKCTWFKRPEPPESHMRKVEQFTKVGVFVATFRSVVEAARYTGSNASKITDVCRGRRRWTNGFVWKYA